MAVDTGIFTGRSPKDKYIVLDEKTKILFGGHLKQQKRQQANELSYMAKLKRLGN